MNSKFKTALIVFGCAFVINLTQVGNAFAVWCAADAAIIYQKILGSFTPFLSGLISNTGIGIQQSITESGAATQAEIQKSTMVKKTVEEGLQANREEQELKATALKMQDTMKQPASTCASIATSQSIGVAAQTTQTKAFIGQKKVMSYVASNTNTAKRLDEAHQATNTNYCSQTESDLKLCALNTTSNYKELAGADQNATFLFQSNNGSSSYDGVDTAQSASPQSTAVTSYIKRVTGGLAPEQLRQQGKAFYETSPQARAYVELSRRYNAMISMGSYSLNQISELHRTQQGLGTSSKMDSVPGFTPGKSDMSYAEMVERFVATKFSPDSVKSSVTAEPTTILRDMAQMSSFQLWMSYQTMLQSSRTEGLMAHQLALMSDQVLRPQIEAQRSIAVRAESIAAGK